MNHEESAERLTSMAKRFAATTHERFTEALDEVLATKSGRTVSFREVVAFLTHNRPADVRPVRGALLRERTITGWLFRVFFLDAEDEPVVDPATGKVKEKRIHAHACDDELEEIFNGRNLIVFT